MRSTGRILIIRTLALICIGVGLLFLTSFGWLAPQMDIYSLSDRLIAYCAAAGIGTGGLVLGYQLFRLRRRARPILIGVVVVWWLYFLLQSGIIGMIGAGLFFGPLIYFLCRPSVKSQFE